MDGLRIKEFADKYLKSLKDDERDRIIDFLRSVPENIAETVVETGRQFYKSSSVNGTWFCRTVPLMAQNLKQSGLVLWLEEGLGICRGAWEISLSYLKASPEVCQFTDAETFQKWVKAGRILVRFSNQEANWFFKHSTVILGDLNRSGRRRLIAWVSEILDVSWRSAVACMRAWPEIIRTLDGINSLSPGSEKAVIKAGVKLAEVFPEDADAYFTAVPAFLRRTGEESWPNHLDNWIDAALLLRQCPRGLVRPYLKATPGMAAKTETSVLSQRIRQWVLLGRRLAVGGRVAEGFFEETPQVLKNLDWDQIVDWADLVEQVASSFTVEGAVEFIRTSPELLGQLDIGELSEWVRHGLTAIKRDSRLAYFALKSQESRDAVSRIRSGLNLEAVKKILLLYCEGLTGKQVIIRNTSDLPEKLHGNDRLFGTFDTRRIYLPDIIKQFDDERENLRLYRAMMMHLVAHRQFGTLDLKREELCELADDPYLGQLFELIEDNRVDYLAAQEYPGVVRDVKALLSNGDGDDAAVAKRNPVIAYLKNYFWSDRINFDDLVPVKIKADIRSFWCKVAGCGASAADSLALARKILQMTGQAAPGGASLPQIRNHRYRGQIKFDLIYMAAKVDDETAEHDPAEVRRFNATEEQDDDLESAGISKPGGSVANFRSDFYIMLKKRLVKFLEDEENHYRLVAFYDEWDRTLNDYKKDWCRVREILMKPSTARIVTRTMEEHGGMINTLKRYFGMLRPDRFRRYGRQEDGEDIDIDAVIEAMVEKKAGVSPDGGFYIRRDKRERDVAVSFLLDLSYSTEEVAPGSGKTLLEIETESVIVMAEALEVLGDKYSIYGFNSDSRDKINFYVVKDFAEQYTLDVKQRFGGLRSYGMTRLAAALRHGVSKLEKVQAAIKIIILLSDGRPFDFDYNSGLTKEHEEFYAEADTRVALREAKMKGINPFCITIDNKGREYLDYIYGNVSYIIIDDVNALPTKLTETYKNLTT